MLHTGNPNPDKGVLQVCCAQQHQFVESEPTVAAALRQLMNSAMHLRLRGFIIEDVAAAALPGALTAIQSPHGLHSQTFLSGCYAHSFSISQQHEYRLPSVSKHDDPVCLL